MVSVRGKTPIPMTQWGIHATLEATGSLKSSRWNMCKWEIPYFRWHDTGGNLSSLVRHRQAPPLQKYSPHLSICGHVCISWKRDVRKSSFRFLPRAFCAGWFTPCCGNGHTNPQWEFQLKATIQHGRLLVSPVFRFDHCLVFFLGGGGGLRGTNPCP